MISRSIELRLTIEHDVLKVTVVNIGEQNLRLWARDNSWGWLMFSLLLALAGSDQWRELTAEPVRWTANIPRALDLPIGGRLEFELRHQEPSWEGLDDIDAWLNQPIQVRVRLRISETPEAVAQGVFMGEALTSHCLSKPPHSWLTGQVG